MATSAEIPAINEVSDEGAIRAARTAFNGQTPETPDSKRTPHRHGSFDADEFSTLQAATSPSQAKKSLEAHLKETDRRLAETSRLGTSLVQQRQELTDRLKDVEKQSSEREIGPDLKKKLVEIEKEYNDLSRDSTRAFLAPKARLVSAEESNGATTVDPVRAASPTKFSSLATDSPSKVNVPSRKQRNAPNKVHDIEFATEISSSLLSQVRQLQAALAEKDESLKAVNLEKAQLEADAQGYAQRLRSLDESEQKYKDENWNLETRTHELMAAAKDASSKEEKLQQSLSLLTSEKNSAQRELDDIKSAHGQLSEEHAQFKKAHDAEVIGYRKSVTLADTDKFSLQRKVEELTSQNQELAKAVAARMKSGEEQPVGEPVSEPDDFSLDKSESEYSPPPSPSKGPQRNSMLEQETMKSSLSHAHRMIQKLKSDIHREKSEKLELKRQLQDSKDDLDARRADAAQGGRKLKSRSNQDLKKNPRLGQLGVARSSRTDVELEDPEWEEHTGEPMPKRFTDSDAAGDRYKSSDTSDAYQTANETEDAFETADEKQTTESEAFHTGAESLTGDSSGDLTETEAGPVKGGTIRKRDTSANQSATAIVSSAERPQMPNKRNSLISTASTSDGEQESRETTTPKQGTFSSLKYRLRLGRGSRRSRAGSEEPGGTPRSSKDTPRSTKDSPASFISNRASKGQTLAAELGEFDSGDDMEGTPGNTPSRVVSQRSTPGKVSLAPSPIPPVPRVPMVDTGVMTEPWEPEVRKEIVTVTVPVTPKKTNDQAVQGTPLAVATSPENVYESSDAAVQRSPVLERSTAAGSSQFQEDNTQLLSASGGPVVEPIHTQQEPDLSLELTYSDIQSVDTEPSTPEETRRSERPTTAIYSEPTVDVDEKNKDDDSGVTEAASAGVIGSVLGWAIGKRQSSAPIQEETPIVEDESASDAKDLSETTDKRTPFKELSPNVQSGDQTKAIKAEPVDKADHGSQTMISAEEIENLMKKNTKHVTLAAGAIPQASAPSPTYSRVRELNRDTPPPTKSSKRPGSSSSMRSSQDEVPPLPADHRQAIEAASQRAGSKDRAPGSMGPPLAPASAYRNAAQRRPITPNDQQTATMQAPTTPTTPRNRYSSARSSRSRRSSVSSFESELDSRFNIRADGMPTGAADPGTDPRMIQAITQTMIGEYLWKYTRKAGRGNMSSNRHRRFFWVHPYTRTLYWSDQDPSQAGRAQLKATSVAIEAIRVVTDDNPMPPGLHRKSIVVITPGREIKFTATTGQRHETWFNAMSYLLLRSGPEAQMAEHITAEDVAEFNPTMGGYQRSGAASRTSLSTYNSRTNTTRHSVTSSRVASPSKGVAGRVSQDPQASTSSRHTTAKHTSVASRISGYWRGSKAQETTHRESVADSSIYDASVVNDSAEDVRQVLEKQDEEADKLENVRACCDGKHDVGSLNRRSVGLTSRLSSRNSHTHSHAH